tara:strand:- start:67 stop:252 length:186 start_codon:yes stop_codon:yes gene_type:complete
MTVNQSFPYVLLRVHIFGPEKLGNLAETGNALPRIHLRFRHVVNAPNSKKVYRPKIAGDLE